MPDIITLRAMAACDLPSAQAVSARFGWPHRLEDWTFLFQLGHGVVAEADGAVIGAAMAWSYGDRVASVGMVVVAPQYQRQNIGARLMDALDHWIGARSLRLNATNEGLHLYQSRGFATEGHISQHQSRGFKAPQSTPVEDGEIRDIHSKDFEVLVGLDQRAAGVRREILMAALVRVSRGLVLIRKQHIVGFILARRFGRGYILGPTVATSPDDAKALIAACLADHDGEFVRLDAVNQCEISDWLEQHGIVRVGQVCTMVKGTWSTQDEFVRTYSVASQSLG